MTELLKPKLRKRVVTGWRETERRRANIRSRHHRSPPVVVAKREG